MSEKYHQHFWSHLDNQKNTITEEQFIYAFNEEQKEGTWNGLHAHENGGELVFVTDGVMVILTKNTSYFVQTNHALWIPPKLEHRWYMPTKTVDRSLHIHSSVLKDYEQLNQLLLIEMSPLLRELVIAVDDLGLQFKTEADKRIGYTLLDRICAAKTCTDVLPMPQQAKLAELCTGLITSPNTQVTLSDWSRELCVSEKTLTRIFLKETGVNFRTWQNMLRMQCAKKDIEAGIQVTEVALNCGYNSLPSFIASFKKMYGVSPSKLSNKETL